MDEPITPEIAREGAAESRLKRDLHLTATMALFMPPLLGGSLLVGMGFYPLGDFFQTFLHFGGIYILLAALAVFSLVRPLHRRLIRLTQLPTQYARQLAKRSLAPVPWVLLGGIAVYSIGGILVTDLSLEALGLSHHSPREHLLHLLGLTPVVLVASFPAFFFISDRLGAYFAPRGVLATPTPIWLKIVMLGLATPLVVGSVLIGYSLNQASTLTPWLLGLWFVLLLLTVGASALAAWNVHRSLSPLSFLLSPDFSANRVTKASYPTPISLDEIGLITLRFRQLLENQADLITASENQKQKLAAILDSTPAIIMILDEGGLIQFTNPQFTAITGYSASEAMGKDWFGTFIPVKDRKWVKSKFTRAWQNVRTQGNVSPIVTKSGELREVEWHDRVIPSNDNRPRQLLVVGLDVTERCQAQRDLEHYQNHLEELVDLRSREVSSASERNRVVVEAAMDGFFTADMQGNIRDCNEAYCQMLGYTKEELLEKTIPDIEGEETPEDTARHIEHIIEHGSDRFDTRHRRKDGSVFFVEVKVSIATIDGEPFFFAFVHDISERVSREIELRQAREEADRANAAKSEFLSRMSHELRTPLNAILGFGQLMETDQANPIGGEQADNLAEIMIAARHLLGLVNEVLDLSRIESGQIQLSPENTVIRDVIQSCITQMSPLALEKQVTLNTDLRGPNQLVLDPTRLRQIILNLLSNAIKYNREGGTVELTYLTGTDDGALIQVRDTGRGIPADKWESVFQPFERLESSLDGIEGTGVGLPLTKRLAEAMGGSIELESTPGVGSTFRVRLPAAHVPDTDHTPQSGTT